MGVTMSAMGAVREAPAPEPAGREPVRVAVVGAGRAGREHLAAIGASPRCALAAIVDPAPGDRKSVV